nr:hypothetical protein [Vibrio sp. Isolate30]
MQFAPNKAGGVTNNGALQTHGDITDLAVEFNIIGGPTAPPIGHNGPTLISYGTTNNPNEFYVWDPTNLTIRIHGHEYKTGIAATDGHTHRYSVLWSSSTGDLELLVDGVPAWTNPSPVGKGASIPGGGILAIGNDQDSFHLETGSHTDHGFSTSDAFSGQMFSVSLATTHVTANQLANAPLSMVVDAQHGLVIDMRVDATGQFIDTTGHHQITPTIDVHSHSSMVDTAVAIPNSDALIHLRPTITTPTDSSDTITKVALSGLVSGTEVSDAHGHTHLITDTTDIVDIKDWDLASLTARLPGGTAHNMNIGITVTTEGPDGVTATQSIYQTLVLDPTQAIPSHTVLHDEPLQQVHDESSIILLDDAPTMAEDPTTQFSDVNSGQGMETTLGQLGAQSKTLQNQHDNNHQGTAAAYLDALGIQPNASPTTGHDQPADMDIVLAQVDQQHAVGYDQAHLDMSDALEHHDAANNHNQDDEHHHHNDVDGLPDIDPNN